MRARILTLLIAIALIVTACSESSDTEQTTTSTTSAGTTSTTAGSTSSTTTQPTAPAGPAGRVVVAIPSFGREVLNPVIGSQIEAPYLGAMFDYFIGLSPDAQISRDLGALESWEMNDDATVWTLTLRDGMTFHDGTPVTAEDGAFSIEEYTTEEANCSRCGNLKNLLDSTRVVDERTFEVSFNAPFPAFEAELTPANGDMPILPKAYYERVGVDGFNEAPIGSGPYKFVKREIGESVEYEANLDYWNPNRIPGFLTLEIRLVPDDLGRLALVERGDVDLAQMTPTQAPNITSVGLDIRGPKGVQTVVVAFGQASTPEYDTGQLELRKAIALAIDTEAIFSALYPGGTAVPAASMVNTPLLLGYDPSLEPYPYDPDQARAILEGAGLSGTQITLLSWTNFSNVPELPILMEAVTGYLEAVGLDPTIEPVDYTNVRPFFRKEGEGAGGLVDLGLVNPLHGWFVVSTGAIETVIRIGLLPSEDGGSFGTYWDPDYVRAQYAAIGSSVDPDERQRLAAEMNRAAYDSYALVPVSLVDQVWAARDTIGDWKPTSFSPLDPRFETLRPAG